MDSKAGSKANLKKYINVEGKWRFVPVAKHEGKPSPNTVLIDGTPTASKTGTFYLEWRQDGKRVQKPVGSSPREALNAWRVQTGLLTDPTSKPEMDEAETDGRVTVEGAFSTFLREVKATKSSATYSAYSSDLEWFKKEIKRHYASQVNRNDIIRLMGRGREEELNQKTINKRLIVALMALRNAGAVIQMKKGDWPKTTDVTVEIYEPEEVRAFFAACTPAELLLFQTFYCSGFRAREMATLCWADVDWKQQKLTIRPKAQYGFKPKNYEERAVTVPASLIESLKEQQKLSKGALMFPSQPHPKRPNYGGDAPDGHHLELCKEIAYRAGLNCGHCKTAEGQCSKGPTCKDWYLHKWRHTFATNLLQSGLDIKSLQVFLGHKNLSTTEIYLKSLHSEDLRQKIESSSLAAMLG